jgi:hypothetical protein
MLLTVEFDQHPPVNIYSQFLLILTEKLFINFEVENNYRSFLRSFGGLENLYSSSNSATTNEIFRLSITREINC